jgi:First Longin domain of INTU, CCZ1 and HPS4
VPGQLSFLSIYNPSLGNTDETLHEQIVYYTSREQGDGKRYKVKNESTNDKESEEQENERLRQVGLAQGMVDFVK